MKTKIDEGIQPADAHRLLAPGAADVDSGHHERAKQGGPRPLVLLVERDAADGIEYFLRTEGYDVDVATDMPDAERKFSALSPQLAVVEILLSGGDGWSCVAALKERHAAPVLAVSALDVPDAAIGAGADAFLQKP